MSSSDYTHLRKIRHVYHPSVSRCNSHHVDNLHYGNPYSHHHSHAPVYLPSQPHVHHSHVSHSQSPCDPHVHHSPCAPHVHHSPCAPHAPPCAPHTPPCVPHTPPCVPHVPPCVSYPSYHQYPVYLGGNPHVHTQPYYHDSVETVVVHTHPSTCHNLPTVVHDKHEHHSHHHHHHPHHPHHLDHHHDDAYEHGHELGHRHGHTYLHAHDEDDMVDHHHHHHGHSHRIRRFCEPSSSTRYQYLISPNVNGTVTFTIEPNLSFTKDMRISVTSDLSSNNYFEGNVYTYNPCNGEITIYKISTVNGTFNKPTKYTISFGASFQEFDKLKLRTAELELKVFGTDASGNDTDLSGNLTTEELNKANLDVTNLFKYFFNEIITNDENYAKTETYLTLKVHTLYNYFFDVNLDTNTAFNPNNNGVVLDTLPKKIGQLNYYFFGNTNPSLNF